MKKAILTVLALTLVPLLTSGEEKLDPRMTTVLSSMKAADPVMIWVHFTDKGPAEALSKSVPTNVVTERSLRRRLKVRTAENLVDYDDLPVSERYIQALERLGFSVRQRSKWFNAVSGILEAGLISRITELPFVRTIEPVARFGRAPRETPVAPEQSKPAPPRKTHGTNLLDYGESFGQLNQINVPPVHSQGNSAQDVIVGVFDNGFRLPSHEVFDSMKIKATYDFVDHKVSVVPNNPSTAFGSHGVNTLSVIGGMKQGQLIGPAFGATFILARTENDSSETPVEEDNWIAAIEWADSLGVDVTSTSLGYLDYDAPYASFGWADMNGNTMMITKAADMAAGRGIVVVNSAGNNGYNASHNTLNAPADGDSVLSIGAVNPDGSRSGFSSVGPTTSIPPRIKPDVMAQGSGVRIASSTNPTGYSNFGSGTSFACPLAAGVAALLVHADPQAGPVQIANALRSTASNAGSPNNLTGWGIIDALAAINALSPTGTQSSGKPLGFRLLQNYPNPFNPTTTIQFSIPVGTYGRTSQLQVYDLLGREVATLVDDVRPAGTYTVSWNPGATIPSGVYFYRLTAGTYSATRKMILQK
jgi:serine protease AprX